MNIFVKQPWYAAGLHFSCMQCGQCCSGPEEGYIWVTPVEIKRLADEINMTVGDFKKKYTRKVGTRTTLIEDPVTKDCIFLKGKQGHKGCAVYHVRPNQCRTWPFWDGNLYTSDHWNAAAANCPGINRGRHYTLTEIEQIKNSKWWLEEGNE